MTKQTPGQPYRGRFAPSPTGPLHIGSLLAALGSYLQAKHNDGQWLVRIEDLDPPREVIGASEDILRTLEYFHLYWDRAVTYQSQRYEFYQNALEALRKNELIFPCSCSRKTIQANAEFGPLGMIYPGTCRANKLPGKGQHSLRLIVPDKDVVFTDKLKGKNSINLLKSVGDINLFRADGLYAYHLAVTVDDQEQNITEIVRGSDLLHSTPVHLYLQHCLSYPTPSYVHLPVLENARGEKLSKQTGAERISQNSPRDTLIFLLDLLGQNPPKELKDGNLDEILEWGIYHWKLSNIPKNNIKVDSSSH